ncbi:MAG TPA: BON domain-containing protein [Armatimonadota bacterium]|jgi:osmotically-inducible protein OsmY
MAEPETRPDADPDAPTDAETGWMEGAMVPPVAFVGPSAGIPNMGLSSSVGAGSGIAAFATPVIPVVGDHRVGGQIVANPFSPAEPRNDSPFNADIPDAADLPSRVESELAEDGRMAGASIAVTVGDDGVVTLTGVVPSRGTAADAADVAAHVPGVRGVTNLLTVSE